MSVFVTPDEMRAAEAAAVAVGRSEPDLMREAASRIAEWVDTHVRRRAKARRLAVALVGPGNNGGDAIVALALLAERGWQTAAVMLGRHEIGTLPAHAENLSRIEFPGLDSLAGADVILDGVYGVGGRPSLPPEIAAAFQRAHDVRIERGVPLIAIDVPSGIDPGSGAASEDAFHADVTLCLGLPKIGLIREPAATHVGELELLDIGIAPPPGDGRPMLITESSVRRLLPRRRATAHKHQTGTVIVVGGAPTYYGAPRLSAESAARAGAGLVCVAAPSSTIPVIAGQVPELVVLPLDESGVHAADQIGSWIEQRGGHVDALVIGPGLGQSPHVDALLGRLFERLPTLDNSARGRDDSGPAIVLDADALNWIAKRGGLPTTIGTARAVMTPHVGELGRLLQVETSDILDDPIGYAKLAAERFGQTVILKSGYSLVSSAEGVAIAPRAAPELATAGTGDVLAGLVGGLLAQGLQPRDAGEAALFIGAKAGLLARHRRGTYGVMARDVIEEISGVMRAISEPDWSGDELIQAREEM